VDSLVSRHDIIIHCGGLSSAWGPAAAFQAANVLGTHHIVEACLRHGVRRLVFVSTPSLYDISTGRLNLQEDAPLASPPVNAYAASKLAAEQVVRAAARRGLGTVIVRPRAIFGPHDSALLPRLLRVAARGWLPLIDGGRAVIDLSYVENVAAALAFAAIAGSQVDGQTYNVSGGEPRTIVSILRTIVAEFGLNVRFVSMPFRVAHFAAGALEALAMLRPGRPEPPLTRYSVGVLGRSCTLSIAAAQRDLGYTPPISLDEGIRRTAAWWRAAHA
jgi:2-alkyl-3-oxoalkanoate reductase